ncbi:putative 28S ribosomal protein S26, mitochondrial [Cyphomyrmex costatus]|uniref:Small ribosomal subunit protein mS26 n=2 Tax=Cyphomyrmex costatus TaxID=456900 RepID=A0A195D1D7_9HYME|nr:putative 28S ribosomal protein S26, mitochondrial [Cyphomyrmex costatus]
MGTTGFCETFIPNSVYTQCIRWKRKPIWLPTAKSKMFRVPERPVIPMEDYLELKRLYNNYRTYITSFKAHLRQIVKENETQFSETVNELSEEEDFEACNAINNEWNAEIANIREIRLAKIKEKKKNAAMEYILRQEQKQEKQKIELNEWVKKVKKESVTFITAENIDAAIEECLTNVVNHNRALDLEGNWHEGKYPPISPIPPVEEEQKPVAIERQN